MLMSNPHPKRQRLDDTTQLTGNESDEVDWKRRLDTIESVVVHQQEQIRNLESKNKEQMRIFEAKHKVLELQLQQLQNQIQHQQEQKELDKKLQQEIPMDTQSQNQLRLRQLSQNPLELTASRASLAVPTNNESSSSLHCLPSFLTTMNQPKKKTRVKKRIVENGIELKDFPQRKHLPIELHSRVSGEGAGKSRRSCAYCSLLYMEKKITDQNASWDANVRRTNSECSYCKVVLCKSHFQTFHELP